MDTNTFTRRAFALASAALITISLAACSEDEDPPATTRRATTTSTTEATTTTEAPDAGDEKDPNAVPDESGADPWALTAVAHREHPGMEIDYTCTPDGEPHTVWGTNLYTDDSSVCTAAVHVGLITFEEGGDVTILIEEGAEEYLATTSNDVESWPYGSWTGSFSFPEADPIDVAEGIPWDRTAVFYADRDGVIEVICAAGGVPDSVWGTDTYTNDSSICTAAVHAGVIDAEEGGSVAFRLTEGLEAYEGSTANGVTSSDYGSWSGSFEFVDADA